MKMADSDRTFKDAMYEQLARAGQAVAHPKRLELLELLCQGPMAVEQLAFKSAIPIRSVSQHLQHLRAARLVRVEPHGTYRLYRLADEAVCAFVVTLRTLAEQRYAEIRSIEETFLRDARELEGIDIVTLQERLANDSVVLLDVRPADEYAAGHWPGAWSVPLETLAGRLTELPPERTIVAYCRGPYCVLALQAVALLQRHRFHAVRLVEGVSDWRARGLPLERSAVQKNGG